MKRYYVAAGALLLGTSALAWAADKTDMKPMADATVAMAKSDDTKFVDAFSDKWAVAGKFDETKLAMTDSGEKPMLASAETWTDKPAVLGDGSKPQLAVADSGASDKLAMASGKTDAAATGVGGPVEEGATTTASLTPRAASQNYPPCNPGPGDDRCIQLYEPGVRAQLASWNQPTGGLADNSATTAMGGPYEPVDDATAMSDTAEADMAMNGDHVVHAASGEADELGIAAHADYQGVGGPVEAQSGYPPCSPGPGDDRCIQLYEPGVTGAGN